LPSRFLNALTNDVCTDPFQEEGKLTSIALTIPVEPQVLSPSASPTSNVVSGDSPWFVINLAASDALATTSLEVQ